ncbi:unnamed protein product [Adineta steineri]|uniref:Calponin-homology (CH) domain-containing protein n=2 Tax=Adineta steineri TaxID=433720 RepID=A0A814JNG2_9BILA|nr:unnamed protein product [Adineta steineri]CAF3755459.1 unnamed protein product [Adineta steineri]
MAWRLTLNNLMVEELHTWIDSLLLSKPTTRFERDFADGTLVAEVIRYYFPDLIDIHNYISSSASKQKKDNWFTLKRKVFTRLGFDVPEAIITDICNAKLGAVDIFLYNLRIKIDKQLESRTNIQKRHLASTEQTLFPLTAVNQKHKGEPRFSTRSNVTSKSNNNLNNKWVHQSDFNELKQQCLRQQQQLGLLLTKTHSLEHFVQLVDKRINEFSPAIVDKRHTKHSDILAKKQQKK